jgi:hypothetical protein
VAGQDRVALSVVVRGVPVEVHRAVVLQRQLRARVRQVGPGQHEAVLV